MPASRVLLTDNIFASLDEFHRGLEPVGLQLEVAPASDEETLAHLASAEWLTGKVVRGEEFTPGNLPFTEASYPDYPSLETGWSHLEASTRAWLESEKEWTRRIEKITSLPGGKRVRVAYTPEKRAFHMFYHEVHHRAQVMAMLRHMGLSVENLDFSRHAYEWTELE